MRIALLGSRGIPARYSGFETFYEQLATRLADRGHEVTVYNRSHFIRDVHDEYRGVRLVSLPCVRTKHLETISHTFLSTLHAVTRKYDIVYYCIVGNAPVAWLPRLFGSKTLLNVDGQDWAREKWSGFARWYQRQCERIAGAAATTVISDALVIKERYAEAHGIDTVFVPYGADTIRDQRTDALENWELADREYFMYVGRFVPENAIDLLLTAYRRVRTDKRLAVVGDAPYSDEYRSRIRRLAEEDPRVVLCGYVFGDAYAQLSSHAYAYVQPSGIDGTRPALLDQMGFRNCVVVRNSAANVEVIGDYGCSFDRAEPEDDLVRVLQRLEDEPELVSQYRQRVGQRIETYYNWEWVTDFHEDMFDRMLRGRQLISYDDFIAEREPKQARS